VYFAWREITLGILMECFSREPPSRCYHHSHNSFDVRSYLLTHASIEDRDHAGKSRFVFVCKNKGKTQPEMEHFCEIAENYNFYDTGQGEQLLPSLSPLALHAYTPWDPWKSPAGDDPRHQLGRWIRTADHTLNDVLTSQRERPEHMTPRDYMAFGDMRGGIHLQWYHILLQLIMPSLDLNRDETFYLIMQAANQAGPRTGPSPLRDAHGVLGDERFGRELLFGLDKALCRVTGEGDSHVPLCTLLGLATRLLSVSPHETVQEQSLAYLR